MTEPSDRASGETRSSPRIETNEALTLLADDCRREILLELLERAPETSLRIASDAGGRSAESSERPSGGDTTPSGGATDDPSDGDETRYEPKRPAVELYHNHLPRLAAKDVISWDEQAGVVERGSAFPAIRPFVARLDQHSDELPSDWRD